MNGIFIIKTQKYPEQFDPKWIVTESGWPYFRLSALDNQPWKGMYHEAENLIDSFHEHREEYGKGWRSLTLHGLNEDTQSLDSYGDRQDSIKQLDWTWVADKCPETKKFLTDVCIPLLLEKFAEVNSISFKSFKTLFANVKYVAII
mgnify:CR=1 FL=1